jgi:integrase
MVAAQRTRSRVEKLNRSYLARFKAGEEAAYLLAGTVDRVKDKTLPGFHIRLRERGSQWAWANSSQTFTIGPVLTIDADKARSIALGITDRLKARKGVQPFQPAAIRAWIQSELHGVPVEADKPGWTLAEARVKFLAFKEAKRKAKATLRGYKSDLNCPEVEAIAWKKLADVTAIDVAKIRDEVYKRGSVRSNRVRAALSSMFSFARGEPASCVAINPVSDVNRIGQEKKRKRYLAFDELQRVLSALPQVNLAPSVASALLWTLVSGQRKRAVREARRKHLYLEQGMWYALPKRKDDDADRVILIPLTPLMKDIYRVADRYCRRESIWLFPSERTSYRGEQRDVPVAESAMNDAIYRLTGPASKGKEFKYKKGSGKYRLAARVAGPLADLDPFTVHDFRRTLTTLCRDEGMSRSLASALLDHDEDDPNAATVTASVYDQYEPVAERRLALEKWHQILERAGIRNCMASLEERWQTSQKKAA